MKITVGKKYEGISSEYNIPDGDYVCQIIDVESTKGQAKLTMVTSKKMIISKTFWILAKDGKTVNQKAMNELADFATCAMQVDQEELNMDLNDVLGHYVAFNVRNSTWKTPEGEEKKSCHIQRPKRANGFPDGTPSLFEEMASRRQRRIAKEAAEARDAEEQGEVEVESEGASEIDDLLKDIGI